jgi:hypothetical protein
MTCLLSHERPSSHSPTHRDRLPASEGKLLSGGPPRRTEPQLREPARRVKRVELESPAPPGSGVAYRLWGLYPNPGPEGRGLRGPTAGIPAGVGGGSRAGGGHRSLRRVGGDPGEPTAPSSRLGRGVGTREGWPTNGVLMSCPGEGAQPEGGHEVSPARCRRIGRPSGDRIERFFQRD